MQGHFCSIDGYCNLLNKIRLLKSIRERSIFVFATSKNDEDSLAYKDIMVATLHTYFLDNETRPQWAV